MDRITRLNLAAIAALALLLPALQTQAQEFPSKPIRFVVPYAAGTTVDIRARQVADRIAKPLGQSILVENRPGAGATLGAAMAVSYTHLTLPTN